VILLLAGTLVATDASLRYERADAMRRSADEGERAASVINLSMTLAAESLDDVAGLFDASRNVSAVEFDAFGGRILGRSGLSAVSWVERVPAADRAAYEQSAGRPILEGAPTGSRPAGDRAVLYPVTLSASDLSTGNLLGFDEASERVRHAALERAVATGGPVVTAPVALFGSGQRGILIYQPVYRGGGTPTLPAAREGRLKGFVVGAYRVDALMRATAAVIEPGLPLEVRDGVTLLSDAPSGAGDGTRTTVDVGGRDWSVLVGAPPASWGPPLAVLVAGLGLTLFALALAVTLARRERYARDAVAAATAELDESRRSQRALVENSPDVVARYDGDLRCLYANAAIERVTGRPPSAFAGRNMDEVGLPDDMVEALAAAVLGVFETGAEDALDYDLIGPEGLVAMHARLAPERGSDGGVESVLVVSREVTAERTVQVALRASEERHRSLVAAMADGVVMHGSSGAIIACNPAAEGILGLSADQMMGRAPIDPRWGAIRDDGTPFPGDEHPAMVTLRTGEPQRAVTMGIHTPDGSLRWISVSTEAVAGGDVTVVACFTEVTARRDTEREQAALRRIATLVAADAEPARVFERIAEEAADLVGAESAGVIRFDGGLTIGTIVGAWGREGLPLPARGETMELTPESSSGMVAASGRAARVGGRDAPPGHLEEVAPRAGLRSAVSAPIEVDGRPWGALSVATTRPEPLPSGTEDRLTRLAELAALAIMSAAARDQMVTLAATDHLTGLWNRRAFQERLAAEIERARRHERPLSLVAMDIDHFKRVNDIHGHPTGDRVLIEVARRLFATVREGEIVARVGGEEFAWILPETDGEGAVGAAERARLAIAAEPFPDVGPITVSLGVCDLDEGETASELVRLADAALYRSKSNGRDQVTRFLPGAFAPGGGPALVS